MQKNSGPLVRVFAAYCFSFACDYKGEEDSATGFQIIFLFIALCSGILLSLPLATGSMHRMLDYISTLWWAYLALSVPVTLLSGIPLTTFIRNAIPFFLCGISLLVCRTLEKHRVDPHSIVKTIIAACAVSAVFKAFYAVLIARIPLGEMRYQLLSPGAPVLIAYVTSVLFFARTLRISDGALAVITVAPIIISVTRSFMITFFLVVLGAIVARIVVSHRQALGREPCPRILLRAGVALAALAGCIFLTIIVRPGVIDEWVGRMLVSQSTASGRDPTYLSRAAESSDMLNQLNSEPLRFLTGFGLGAEHYYDDSYAPELLSTGAFTMAPFIEAKSTPGHSVWIHALFSGGVIGIFATVGLLFGGLLLSFSRLRSPLYSSEVRLEERIFPFLAFISILSQTFTSNFFGERFSGLLAGLCFGSLFLINKRESRVRAQHRHEDTTL